MQQNFVLMPFATESFHSPLPVPQRLHEDIKMCLLKHVHLNPSQQTSSSCYLLFQTTLTPYSGL